VQQIDLNKVKLSLKSINIDKLIRIINSEIQPILDRKKIDFNYTNNIDKKTEIKIDAIMIKQVLTNILSNAIKYSKAK